MHYDLLLDASKMRCPIPIIRTKSCMSKLTNGQRLLVVVSDPSYYIDCMVFVRQTGHILIESWQKDNQFFYILQHN